MEKKQNQEYLSGSIYIEKKLFKADTDIDSVIKSLQDFKAQGATHLLVGAEWDMHDSLEGIELHPVKVTLESDEDYQRRLKGEQERQKRYEERKAQEEKELYKSLKSKYGD